MAASKHQSDLRTFIRLLGYLSKSKGMVAVVFICIVLEGLFTVLSISSIKPILNLLVKDRFLDKSSPAEAVHFEKTQRVFADGTVAFKGAGSLEGQKPAEELRDTFAAILRPRYKHVVADLRSVRRFGPGAWAELLQASLLATSFTIQLDVLKNAEVQVPEEFHPGSHVALITNGDQQLEQAYLHAVATPVVKPIKPDGMLGRLKKWAYAKVEPTLERLQDYSIESPDHKFRVLSAIIGFMLASAVLMVVFSFGSGYLSTYLAAQVVLHMRNHLYEHMVQLDLGYFNSNSTGNLLSIVLQDVNAVDNAIDILFSTVFKTPIQMIMMIIPMFVLSPSLTLFSFTVLPLMGVLLFVLGKRVRRTSSRIQKVRGSLSKAVEETFSGMRAVKSFNMEKRESERFERDSSNIFRMTLNTTAAEEIGTGLTQFTGIATIAIMLIAGGYSILLAGKISGTDFMMFIILLTQVFRPLKGTSKTNSRVQKGLASCDRVFGVIDLKPTIVDREGAIEAAPLQEAIEFRNITFSYQPSLPPVLHNINLTVPARKAIAFVGETGSGKSTLVNLLPRFFDPCEGSIIYDGHDLRDLKVQSLRDQIALISQDVILFDDTVANNIAYGMRTPPSREQIEQAAKAANAHQFISQKLPRGYDTMIGSRGARLSGGERQRIAIARAILKNSPILILDEATSALDSATEALIQDALLNVIKGRTVFVIAHRLSTIQNCDEIYVIDNGRFVEHGTHEELLLREGRYAYFHSIQFGKSAPAPVC